MRFWMFVAVLILGTTPPLVADIADPDPVSFCATVPSPDTICSGDPNLIGTTSFVMIKNGNSAASSDPWYLVLAVPNNVGGSPTLTSSDFTLQSVTNKGQFSTGDIYTFASLTGMNSMNATNMFGTAEQSAFGETPAYFQIYLYKYTPAFVGAFHPYTFTVGGGGLTPGTFLAASGGSNPFSTPFTTTGLAVSTPDGGMTLILLGSALVGIETLRRRIRA